jgi:enoyl-[acyl-carrier protein] reductase III
VIDLTGKVGLVTGSSRGIGRACALALAQAGADVVVNYLTSRNAALDVGEEIQALGRRAALVKADVSEPEDVTALVDIVGAQFGRLDILVSNVATGGFRPLMETTPEHLGAAMTSNVAPLISLVRAALPLLTGGTGLGKVIALSSHGSQKALPAYGTIGASKAALESVIRHLALELGPAGINFNVVLSGLVETDSTRLMPGVEQTLQEVKRRLLVAERTLTANDVAQAVLFLASPLSDLIQGQTLIVDGGIAIQ